jgi:putative ABC transport system substrate-binding protein
VLLEKSTPSEYQRVFAEIAQNRPDAIMVHGRADLTAYHQLVVELANKGRLPAMYPWRDYAEAGGLMAYGGDPARSGGRMADEVPEILNGAKPGDIPIYSPRNTSSSSIRKPPSHSASPSRRSCSQPPMR